jgi:hypothetical protein
LSIDRCRERFPRVEKYYGAPVIPSPAVYRNGRYEARLQVAESRILQLAFEVQRACGMIEQLANAINVERQIPALPETPRTFGRGH